MDKRFNLKGMREFWTKQAMSHGQSPAASWSDQMVIEMEIREILKYLVDSDYILEVGCANGYSTVQFASQRQIHIRGVDYIPEMVKQARLRHASLAKDLQERVQFDVGDVTDLSEPTERYDKVISTRVIINLGNWMRQLEGLRECIRVLKPGGIFLLSEATLQGWQKLNKFRNEWGLPDIPVPPFNNYLDRARVIKAVSGDLKLIDIVNFASTYYVGTRVIKPILIRVLAAKIDVANPDMEWNRWFAQLPAWGDYGTQELFVFKKNS